MDSLQRRTFLAGTAAFGVAPNLTFAAGHGGLTFGGFALSSADVADCAALAAEIAEIDQEIVSVRGAPDSQIEQFYRNMTAALDKRSGKLKAALDSAKAAVAANDAAVEKAVIKAIEQSNDLLLATAIQTRNPQLVGAAVGVNVVSGSAVLTYQVMTADNAQQSQGAVIAFANGRKRMVMQLVRNKPGLKLAKKQVRMALKLAVTSGKIAAGAFQSGELQQKADEIAGDLAGLDAQVADLPANVEQTREYMLEDLAAQKEIYQLLNLAPNCQINPSPAPLPLPGLG